MFLKLRKFLRPIANHIFGSNHLKLPQLGSKTRKVQNVMNVPIKEISLLLISLKNILKG